MPTQYISCKRKTKWEYSHVNLKLFLVSFFILPLVTCPLWGQVVQKKQLTESDYHLWGTLRMDKVTPNGKWASYRMVYEKGIDTLFVTNTNTNQTYSFPSANNAFFAGNEFFICRDSKGLYLLNLTTGKQEVSEPVLECDYSSETNEIVFLTNANKVLKTLNLLTKRTKTIAEVENFALSPDKKRVVFSTAINQNNSVGLLHLGEKPFVEWIVKNHSSPFLQFAWQESGKGLAFYSFSSTKTEESILFLYTIDTKTLFKLNPKTQSDFPIDKMFDQEMVYRLSVTTDMKSVFFGLGCKPISDPNNSDQAVEIWNGNDKWIYPFEKINSTYNDKVTLAVWHPMTQKVIPLSSEELPKVMLTGNKEYAILSNPKAYEPQFDYDGPRDFYIMDVNTGEKEIFLKKQNGNEITVITSPFGKYVSYFRDDNWWVYDIATKSHTNMTRQLNFPVLRERGLLGGQRIYGNAGWSKNDDELLLYDQYDIWAIKADGTKYRRLTKGREKQIAFRIVDLLSIEMFAYNFNGAESKIINLEEDLILEASGLDQKRGYFKWTENVTEQPIIYDDFYYNYVKYLKKEQVLIYQKQKFDLSPCLIYQKKSTPPKTFFQSNRQQSNYYWGHSKLLSFQNAKGKVLKAALYYPANYNPSKKYPMVVNTYENKSNEIHRYMNPSLLVSDGFNKTVFTLNDYFFLCPDIEFEEGSVGSDVVDCTVSATKEVIATGLVDSSKIGLIGHSFGGYESAFMITQTNIFSAVVAGAGITDLTSFYLTVGGDTGRPDMYRFQSEQWKLGKTPFEDPTLYSKNSPVTNVAAIKTPILIWTGKEDRHVDWHQSVEFYMALRRLGKKQIMLVYPSEKHVILKPNNQIDLNCRILEWFDFYLKKETPALWISKGID